MFSPNFIWFLLFTQGQQDRYNIKKVEKERGEELREREREERVIKTLEWKCDGGERGSRKKFARIEM